MADIVVPETFGERLDKIKDEPMPHPDSPVWYSRDQDKNVSLDLFKRI
jgi:hypothetical protein